jgi:uDENN domain
VPYSLSVFSFSQQKKPFLILQVLFKYPPGKNVGMQESDIPAFCFPEGVKVTVLL